MIKRRTGIAYLTLCIAVVSANCERPAARRRKRSANQRLETFKQFPPEEIRRVQSELPPIVDVDKFVNQTITFYRSLHDS
jgi:hypothetical protein